MGGQSIDGEISMTMGASMIIKMIHASVNPIIRTICLSPRAIFINHSGSV